MFQSFETVADSRSSVSRLASLRAALADAGFDAFLVPRTDAHQGETVAPCDERLAWLTGFTGSAGAALVTADRAALFVDGRYTLQAAAESDAAAFEVVASQRVTPSAWLIETLGAEAAAALRLGFDPMLHGRAEIDRLAEALGRRPEPLSPNPIDALWEDRPPRPAGAIAVHPESLAGEAAGAKRSRLGKALAEGGSDAALLTLPDSIAWLLNIRGSDLVHSPVSQGFAILEADGRVTLFTEPEKIDGAVAAHLGNAVTVAAPDTLLPALAGLSGRKVLVDRASCPLAFTAALEEAGAGLVWGADPCIAAKAIKTEAELAGIRAAHIRDGAAFVRFLHWLETALAAGEPLTEIAIASTLERFRHETGALLDIAFDTICGSGPNGAIVHYRVNRATDRTLQPGEILLVDSGGQYRDGTTDITRTLATGPADAEAARAFSTSVK
ncbi:MAG: aminopeptidase P family N-terminal domain-containing protein, partial [Pseudomonadota bacterium]